MSEVKPLEYTNSRGTTYYLYASNVMMRSGKEQTIYYFSRYNSETKDRQMTKKPLAELPEGYEVVENPRSGFVVCQKVK